MHFSCPVQAVDAEVKWMQDEMASMFETTKRRRRRLRRGMPLTRTESGDGQNMTGVYKD